MTFRIEFSYRCTDFRKYEYGHMHKDIEAESPQRALDALLNMSLPNRGILKNHYEIWDVDIFQLIERPENGWIKADSTHTYGVGNV